MTQLDEWIDYRHRCHNAQAALCEKRNWPHFAAANVCWNCLGSIYGDGTGEWDMDQASNDHITYCRHCNWSFCE
jgi:hypothetical protein